jgi:hypothetical protein
VISGAGASIPIGGLQLKLAVANIYGGIEFD